MNRLKEIIKENRAYFIAVSSLIGATGIALAFNLFFSFNSVRSVQLLGSSDSAQIENQAFLIEFKRPMQNVEVDSYIDFEPELKFHTQWSGRTLVVRVDEDLDANTQYLLKINSEIEDVYDSPMKEDFLYEFKSETIYYYTLDNKDVRSKIIRHNIFSDEAEIIYEEEGILDFIIRDNYLVIVNGQPNHKKAQFINLTNGVKKSILKIDEHIVDIQFHPTKNEVWALQQGIFTDSGVVVPIGNKQIFRYLIDEDKSVPIKLSSEIQSIDSFFISPNGNELLLEESFSERFSIANLDDVSDWIPLGKYAASGGYDRAGESLAFVTLNWANLQDPSWIVLRKSDGEKVLSDKSISSIDPLYAGDKIIYFSHYEKLSTERSLYQLQIVDLEGNPLKEVKADGFSLEYALQRGNYLLIRGYDAQYLVDPFTFEERINSIPAPKIFSLFLYNIESGELTDTGINTSSAQFEE